MGTNKVVVVLHVHHHPLEDESFWAGIIESKHMFQVRPSAQLQWPHIFNFLLIIQNQSNS